MSSEKMDKAFANMIRMTGSTEGFTSDEMLGIHALLNKVYPTYMPQRILSVLALLKWKEKANRYFIARPALDEYYNTWGTLSE